MIIFDHTAHKALWDWLYHHPAYTKDEWPGWRSNGGDYENNMSSCFACLYDRQVRNGDSAKEHCACCPFVNIIGGVNNCMNGLFEQWVIRANHYANKTMLYERKLLARLIRDYPVRDDVICK